MTQNAAMKETEKLTKDEDFIHLANDVRTIRLPHWESVFHQLNVPAFLPDVTSVLEFGPGRGLVGAVFKHYGMDYYSADVKDWGAKPDFLSDIKGFPLGKTYDLVCAFQTLEHNPPEDFIPHLKKMAALSNKYVYISLPFKGRWISANFCINLPKIDKSFSFTLSWPRLIKKDRPIDTYRNSENPYQHHWFEVGDKGYSKKDMKEIAQKAGLKVTKDFHSKSFPYHYFMLMEKI